MLDKEYRDNKGVSQSFLKELEGYPKYLTLGERKKSKAFEIGSLVDLLLTAKDSFDMEYVIYDGTFPTEKMRLLADRYIELALIDREMSLKTDHVSTVLQARIDVDFDSRLKTPTVLDKFNESAYEYTQFVLANPNRLVISKSDYLWAMDMVNETIDNPITGYWLREKESVTTVLFQQPLYFDWSVNSAVIECKALPDIIHINHVKKTINLLDIKTYEGDFESNYFKFRYYYQSEFYMEAIRRRLNHTLIPDGYMLENFYFIAIDKGRFKPPLVYKHNPTSKGVVMNGGTLTDSKGHNIKIKGLNQLFKEYLYHSETGDWEYPYNYLKQKHILL